MDNRKYAATFVMHTKNKDMIKKGTKSTGRVEKPFGHFYSVVARACGCSSKYVKLVLEGGPLGSYKGNTYQDRDTELVRRIRARAEEIRRAIEPTDQ